MKYSIFQKIERNEYSLQELSNVFFDLIFSKQNAPDRITLLNVESLLLWFYNNDREYQNKEKLFYKDETQALISSIKSKLENGKETRGLAECFEHIQNNSNYDTMDLSSLIKKINLTESVAINI